MKIWVDADACPVVIKDILFKAAERTQTELTLVANQPMRVPGSRFIKSIQVQAGFDVADNEIVKLVEEDDLVITSDIPLADEYYKRRTGLESARRALHSSNIKSRLNIRDFMDIMRASGEHTGGPPPLAQSDRQQFANHLDRILTKVG